MPNPGGPRPARSGGLPLQDLASWLGDAGATLDLAGDSPSPVVLSGVELDSRELAPGDLYAALPGSRAHGASFAVEAARSGAVAVLTDPHGLQLVREAGVGLPVLVVPDPRALAGAVAARVHGDPGARLLTFGVTGTNGKTTTTYLLDGALRASGRLTGMVGTVETRIGARHWPSARTTPEAPRLHALLATMVEEGVDVASMEVSSHGLVLHRVEGLVFDVAGFTNLSQDHLDFHSTMEEYFAAKRLLFTPAHSRRGVVCVDGDWGRRMAQEAEVPVVTLATRGGDADWTVTDRRPDAAGTDFTLTGPDGVGVAARCPLPGDFNVANAALAIAMLVGSGQDAVSAATGVARAGSVPGRMEIVPGAGTPGEPTVVVDYAHTPDAVEVALRALRPTATGPLVIVLGAGGDRDRAKRGPMGAAAATWADVLVVTDDNPRTEVPADIRAAVVAGAREVGAREAGTGTQVIEVERRRRAIAEGVRAAWGGGTLLVAGKGHEQGQEVAGVIHPFDDRVEAAAALALVGAEAVAR